MGLMVPGEEKDQLEALQLGNEPVKEVIICGGPDVSKQGKCVCVDGDVVLVLS